MSDSGYYSLYVTDPNGCQQLVSTQHVPARYRELILPPKDDVENYSVQCCPRALTGVDGPVHTVSSRIIESKLAGLEEIAIICEAIARTNMNGPF
jgi:hypothetical protein